MDEVFNVPLTLAHFATFGRLSRLSRLSLLPLHKVLCSHTMELGYRWFSWGVASLLEGKNWDLCLAHLCA